MCNNPKAAIILIGNEILSGKTQDQNMYWLGGRLNSLGIKLAEARVVPDIEKEIVNAVNECRKRYDYVFTSGGIGPTHDDITISAIAAAFNQKVIMNPEAERMLREYYPPEEQTEARMRMALTPEGASLIVNKISAAPGIRVENVWVLAGVPNIFKAMFEALAPQLTGGKPIKSLIVKLFTAESNIAQELAELQNKFTDIEIGSYPFKHQNRACTRLVLSGTDELQLSNAMDELVNIIKQMGFAYEPQEQEI